MVSSWKVATIDPQTEVFQYVTRATPPHCDRGHCLLRAWHRDVPTGRYVVVGTSVSHPQAELKAGVRVVHMASHYLLQPCAHGTHVTAICREDWRYIHLHLTLHTLYHNSTRVSIMRHFMLYLPAFLPLSRPLSPSLSEDTVMSIIIAVLDLILSLHL